MDFGGIVAEIVKNPLIWGMIAPNIWSAVKVFLQQVDDKGELKSQPWLSKTALVLAFVATAASLAMQGRLHELNVQAAGDFLIALIGVNGAGTKTVTTIAQKVNGTVK